MTAKSLENTELKKKLTDFDKIWYSWIYTKRFCMPFEDYTLRRERERER